MIDSVKKQMSAIFKEMALTTLVDPEAAPSSEAVAAALLLSHVAWQRANGDEFVDTAYALALAEMQTRLYPGKDPQEYYMPSMGGENASYRRVPWWLKTEDFIDIPDGE